MRIHSASLTDRPLTVIPENIIVTKTVRIIYVSRRDPTVDRCDAKKDAINPTNNDDDGNRRRRRRRRYDRKNYQREPDIVFAIVFPLPTDTHSMRLQKSTLPLSYCCYTLEDVGWISVRM